MTGSTTTGAQGVSSAPPSAPARLTTKDLINVGVFSALYIAVFYVAAFVGVVPVFMAALPLLLPIVTGIPFMLYLTRVHAFGMVSITGVLVALVMFAGGHTWLVLVIVPVAGLLADLVLKSGGYRRWTTSLLGFGVFSLWVFGPMLPFFLTRDAYTDYLTESMGAEYAQAVLGFIPTWYLYLIPVLVAVGTLIGGYLGRATLRKHFVRAGIA